MTPRLLGFGGFSGSASGVLLNLELTIVSAATCSPLADYAVGRWHCDAAEVYKTLEAAQSVTTRIATSQIALPKASCDLVDATSGYVSSVRNLSLVVLRARPRSGRRSAAPSSPWAANMW